MFSDGRLPTRVLCFSLRIRINLRKLFHSTSASFFCIAKAVVSGISPRNRENFSGKENSKPDAVEILFYFCLTWQMFSRYLEEMIWCLSFMVSQWMCGEHKSLLVLLILPWKRERVWKIRQSDRYECLRKKIELFSHESRQQCLNFRSRVDNTWANPLVYYKRDNLCVFHRTKIFPKDFCRVTLSRKYLRFFVPSSGCRRSEWNLCIRVANDLVHLKNRLVFPGNSWTRRRLCKSNELQVNPIF